MSGKMEKRRSLFGGTSALRELWRKYRHLLWGSYFFFYLVVFGLLERRTGHVALIHCALDDVIPFLPVFIIPYLLWFLLVGFMFFFLALKYKEEYYLYIIFLCVGMTIFLLVSAVFPNGLRLRPDVDAGRSVFHALVYLLYQVDTPTNVFPSIHVYNSIGVLIAARKNGFFGRHRVLQFGICFLAVLICFSTVFLKQHSVIDVTGACVMAACCYRLTYHRWEDEQETIGRGPIKAPSI